jgi:hypothetical protein
MKKGFFDDEKGNRSMMRLQSFIVVTAGVSIITLASVWMILFSVDLIGLIGVIIGFVTTGLGAKWLQKKDEK